jgi:hypothetical protein
MRKNPGGHEPREVAAVREPHASPVREPLEGAREHETGPSHEITLPQHEVGGEVMSGPALEQRGHRRPQLVEQVAQLPSLLRVEGEIAHPGEIYRP